MWALAPGALSSCASGADAIPQPSTGEDGGKTGSSSSGGGTTIPFPSGAGSSGGGEDDASGADDTGSGNENDSSSNDTPDVATGDEDASAPDDASDDTGTLDVGVSEDTGTANEHDSGGGTVPCGGIPAWFAGTTATEVQNFGIKYTCMVEGWCSETGPAAIAAYEPGTGSAWDLAWIDEGACSAGGDE